MDVVKRASLEELMKDSANKQIIYNKRVTPNCKPVIGVRVPKLREIAKEIARIDYRTFLEQCEEEYFEQEMLKVFVIGYAKDDIETILSYADQVIPMIHDWAVNDGFCQTFSIARKNRELVYQWQKRYASQNAEFPQRVSAVLLMSHFLTEEYIDQVLLDMNQLHFDGYYTKMGVAWCIATAYAKFPAQTKEFIYHNQLDDFTFNKSLSKMCESFRVPEEDKIWIRQMKRK